MILNIIEVEAPVPAGAPAIVETEALIRDVLGVDPDLLGSMSLTSDDMNGPALYGLQAFMRRVLELAIQLRETPEVTIHLKSESGAGKVHGWPSARIANIAMLFVWAMIREGRWHMSLPFARLEAAGNVRVDPPITIEQRLRDLSIDELVTRFRRMPETRESRHTLPEETFPVSASTLVRSYLNLEPATLTRSWPGSEAQIEAVFQGKPESRAVVGLQCLISAALREYKVMRTRDSCRLRLKSDADSELAERPSPRAARLITLLAAALHADNRHNIVFLPPRTRSAEDEADLRAVAKMVYRNYTHEMLDGLELICDSNVHFGWDRKANSLAKRLLGEVACDYPDADVPYVVQLQQWSDGVVAQICADRKEHDPDPSVLQ